MLPVCPCLARRSLSPDSGVAAILSSLTQSPGEQSTLFHVVVQQLNTESRSVVSELQQAPEFALLTPNPFAPFRSWLNWEITKWAKMCGPGSTAVTKLLQIEGVSGYYGELELY